MSPVVNDEKMTPDHSALTLMSGWHEGHPAVKNTCSAYPQRFSFWTTGGRKL